MKRTFHYSIFSNQGMIAILYLMSINYRDQLELLPPAKNDPIIAQLYLQYATCFASASLKNRSNTIHAENTFSLERRSFNEFYRQNRI